MRTVSLTYFKKSGKYYTDTTYETSAPEYYDFQIYDEVLSMLDSGTLPGLAPHCREFNILIHGDTIVPHLILSLRE